MAFTYYHQNRIKENSLRRYRNGSQEGERWCQEDRVWSNRCCPRGACLTTKDEVLSPDQAEKLFPGSVYPAR